MDTATRTRIVEAHRLRKAGTEPPADEALLAAFEKLFGAIPADVRWYLGTCGGGTVGDETLQGVRALAASHRKFADGTWQMRERDAFVIGWDATGGPIGIERKTGQVIAEDGFFGGISVLAPSFEQFLIDGLVDGQRRWAGTPFQAKRKAV